MYFKLKIKILKIPYFVINLAFSYLESTNLKDMCGKHQNKDDLV